MEEPQTQLHGPFTSYKVTVDGYLVPGLDMQPLGGADDGSVNVILGQLCVMAEAAEARKWAPMIAHALAISAGFTCHGKNSRRANPHKVKLMQIGEVD